MSFPTLLSPRVSTLDVAIPVALGKRRPVLKGVPLCTGFRATGITNGLATAQTTAFSFKWSGVAGFDATDLRVLFVNWRTNQYNEGTRPYEDTFQSVDGYTQTIRTSVVVAGVVYEVTYGGKRDGVVDLGGWIESDPIPVDVAAGDVIATQTFMAAQNWRTNAAMAGAPINDGAGFVATLDKSSEASTIIADTGGSGFVPAAITATPKNKGQRTVILHGASDAEGVGDGYAQNGFAMAIAEPRYGSWGWIIRSLRGKTGVIQTARTGDRLDKFLLPNGHKRRMVFSGSCSDAITTMGLNDVIGAVSLATIQAGKITEWFMLAAKGCRVWQTTWSPISASTDNWKTLANQTPPATDAVRTGANDWFRDGAPMNVPANTAAAVGAAGAGVVRMGSPLHPLFGVIDYASSTESSLNSGKWTVTQVEALVGSMTSGSNVVTTPARTWTSADLYSLMEVTGAGAGGIPIRGYVSSVSGNTCTLITTSGAAVNAGTTVSGTAIANKLPTVDGLHGTNDIHIKAKTDLAATFARVLVD